MKNETKYSKEQLENAIKTSKTIRETLIKLELVPFGGNYENLKHQAEKHNISIEHLCCSRQKFTDKRNEINDNDIIEICKNLKSRRAVLITLGLSGEAGSNIRWINEKVKELSIDTTHWTGQIWNKGDYNPGINTDIDAVLNNKKKLVSHKLKLALLTHGIMKNECSICNLNNWEGKEISLHLHHIDGNNQNNNLSNLELLCPNCHAQTKNYCRNKKSINLIEST